MRKIILLATMLASSAGILAPAGAVPLPLGLGGGISVGNDFGACAHIVSSSAEPFIGTFSAVGQMQGPSTRAGTVRAAMPIHGQYYWSACIPGAYDGATAGEAKYVLHAHSVSGEYVEVQQCVVNRGVVTCF